MPYCWCRQGACVSGVNHVQDRCAAHHRPHYRDHLWPDHHLHWHADVYGGVTNDHTSANHPAVAGDQRAAAQSSDCARTHDPRARRVLAGTGVHPVRQHRARPPGREDQSPPQYRPSLRSSRLGPLMKRWRAIWATVEPYAALILALVWIGLCLTYGFDQRNS